MTENKGDLISREALKEHKFLCPDNPNATRFYDEKTKAYQQGWNDCIDAIIDNAPTVEAKTTEDCIIAYGDGYETARQLYARPQGEWKCPECGEWLFACPNCGADMRGKEE